MARHYALAVLLALTVGNANCLRDDAVSFLQGAAQSALQPGVSQATRWTKHLGGGLKAVTFKVGEIAEVKSIRFAALGGWVICHIIGPGKDKDAYDVVIPGTAVMKNVPVLMLRKKRKAKAEAHEDAQLDAPPAAPPEPDFRDMEGSIDGEPGESVEILVTKGPKAGSWVRGSVVRAGSTPDCFDIRFPKRDGGFKLLSNVPGNSLRKVDATQTLMENVTFQAGDRIEVKTQKTGTWLSAVVVQLGDSPNTYTLYMQGEGYLWNIPKKYIRPKRVEDFGVVKLKKEEELTDAAFQVGDDVEAKVIEGDLAGMWLKARISARGHIPFTYRINMTQWKIEDLVNVFTYHELLRRPGQALNRAALTSYDPGEKIEFKMLGENSTTASRIWWNGTIAGKGQAVDSYDIVQPSGERIPSLPVELIRKVYFDPSKLPMMVSRDYRVDDEIEYRNILTGFWNKGRVVALGSLQGTYDLDSGDLKGTVIHWVPPEMIRRPATSFQVGDSVEVESHKRNEFNESLWSRCTVDGMGKEADTYDIFLEEHGMIRAVPFKKLRKASSVASKDLMRAYEVGEKVMMKSIHGTSAGDWVGATVLSRGFVPFTYNLTVPGMGVAPNVPIELVRKVPSSRFKVGEFVKVKIASGPLAGSWANGLVAGHGALQDMFNISYWNAGLAPDIPLELLRKENQPYRPEDIHVFEVGANIKVRVLFGPDKGKWLPGTVKAPGTGSMVLNTTDGPRPLTYTVTMPDYAEVGDIADIPVELIVRDEFAMRPMTVLDEFQANETVRLRGVVGARGAQWVKTYVVKNGTKRDSYNLHLPGVGVYENVAIELLRHPGIPQPHMEYQAGEAVEMKDIFDLGDDTKIWMPVRVVGKGKRPETYDVGVDGTDFVMESIPVEILRRADGREFRPIERTYFPGQIVEVKDVLGIIAPNATTKAVFRVLGEGTLAKTYDLEGVHVGVIRDVPALLMKRVPLQDALNPEEDVDVGDFVECNEVDKPGNKVNCYVDGIGERPGTFNVRITGYTGVFPNIPASRLYKRPAPVLQSLAVINNASLAEGDERPEEMKVGDRVEVYDKRKKEDNWIQATIKGKGDSRRTWDVQIGDLGVFRNVPQEKLRHSTVKEEPQTEQTTSTTSTQPLASQPLQVGDIVRYVGPGANASNASTMWNAMVVGEGQAPSTINLGLDSGFVLYNIPIFYVERNMRYATTTHRPDIMNTFSSLGNVLPTIRLFRAIFKKQEDEWLEAKKGDFKAQAAQDFRGKNLGDGSVTYEVGEKAEVQIKQGEFKGHWAPCIISGMGRWANSYNIHVPEAQDGFRDIPNVGSLLLRKVGAAVDPEAEKIKAASPCTEDERTHMLSVLEQDGFFKNNPEECSKVATLMGVNQEGVGKCVERKLSISDKCAQCAVDFAKGLSAGDLFRKSCVVKCMGMAQVCKSETASGACASKIGDCLSCAKAPAGALLRCVGAASSTTAGKLDKLAEAAATGQLLMPGGPQIILGADWVERRRGLLGQLLSTIGLHVLSDNAEPEPSVEAAPTGPQTFEIGDKAEIRIQKGQYAGMWVECDITGVGKFQGTYNIHVPDAPKGQQDFPDVSALILRRSEFSPEKEESSGSTHEQTDQEEDPL